MVGKRKSAKKTEQEEPPVKKTGNSKDGAQNEEDVAGRKVKDNQNGAKKEDEVPLKKLRERKETKPEVNHSKSSKRPKKESRGREYEVEAIIDQRSKSGKQEFLIKWKGYGEEDNSWVAKANLNCQRLLEKFLKSKK